MKKYISVNNIAVELNSKSILKNISFNINEGEILAITGTSGNGKTTLRNVLSGNIQTNQCIINKNINHATYIPQQEDFLNVSQQKSTHYSSRYEYNNESLPTVKNYLNNINGSETDRIIS